MKFFRIALVSLIFAAAMSQAHAGTCFLRQSTASQNLTLPTFVDSTDFVTAETGLTIANTDVKLTKGFAATTQTNKNSGGATHIATGDYYITLDATDTNTVGVLKIKVAVAGALPVWVDCFVLPAVNYDALFVTAPGASTGLQIAGSNAATTFATLTVTGTTTLSDGLVVNRSTSNASAIVATGNGTGNGATFTSGSGATGNGASFVAASTNGSGMVTSGTGTGSGQLATGGATGHGFSGVGGATSGNGIRAAGTAGNSAAMNLVGQGSAAGLLTTGGATGVGAQFTGGSTSGSGAQFTGSAGNSTAMNLVGQGSASGLTATGGATGHGINAVGGATSGSGLRAVASTSGNGILATGVGTSQAGIAATGGATSSAGISATGGGTGSGILATSGSGATGNGITATAASTNGNGIGLTATGTGVTMTATPVSSVGTGAIVNSSFACTGGSFAILGVVECGTGQAAASTTFQLRSAAALADDTANGMTLLAQGSTQGYYQSRAVTDYVGSTDTATVDAFTVTPTGTFDYYLFGTAPSTGGGGGLDAAGVRAALGYASASHDTDIAGLNTKLDTIDDYVDTEVAAILDDTGTSGVVIVNDGITAAKIAANAIGDSELNVTGSEFTAIPWNAAWDAEVQSEADDALVAIHLDHLLAADYDPASKPGTATALLNELVESDSGVSRFTVNALENGPSGSGASAEAIADEVETRTIAGVTTVGTVNALAANSVNASALATDAVTELQSGLATASSIAALNNLSAAQVNTEVDTALADYDPPTRAELTTDTNSVLTAVGDVPTNAELATALGTADDAVLAAIAALNNLSAAQVRDLVIEDQGSITLGCALASILAYTSGDIATSGGNSTYEESTGTETRMTITVTSPGNRTSTITCPTY